LPGKDRIIIANASGFWGDEAAAVARQVRGGPIDYLMMDYLAEITMIILARQKAESEELGYARDFVAHVGRRSAGDSKQRHHGHRGARG